MSCSTDQGFSKDVRLLAADEFRTVFRKGRRSHGQYFTVYQHQNSLGHARLGLAVAKKNLRHAVDRNRVKRIIREWFRLQRQTLPEADIVVLAKVAAGTASKQQLKQSLNEIMTGKKRS
ncbi:MAG: ribonuclease P protein component [Proteobacteria bacterium]|nr:ribonuclease P protein component [Pseudomonadota bacterium]